MVSTIGWQTGIKVETALIYCCFYHSNATRPMKSRVFLLFIMHFSICQVKKSAAQNTMAPCRSAQIQVQNIGSICISMGKIESMVWKIESMVWKAIGKQNEICVQPNLLNYGLKNNKNHMKQTKIVEEVLKIVVGFAKKSGSWGTINQYFGIESVMCVRGNICINDKNFT